LVKSNWFTSEDKARQEGEGGGGGGGGGRGRRRRRRGGGGAYRRRSLSPCPPPPPRGSRTSAAAWQGAAPPPPTPATAGPLSHLLPRSGRSPARWHAPPPPRVGSLRRERLQARKSQPRGISLSKTRTPPSPSHPPPRPSTCMCVSTRMDSNSKREEKTQSPRSAQVQVSPLSEPLGCSGSPRLSHYRQKTVLGCDRFLCLSRACLGEMMHFIYKWLKKHRSSFLPAARP
jgi:hypothetical protein